ncbi:hypothetical protein CLOM621_06327 [Clostridium sp. M62/1]|nr:hypothetical protein CLOM621_06327 [Clostridium sp. M62/1]
MEKKMSLSRPAAGGESCEAGSFFITLFTLRHPALCHKFF